MIFTEPHLDGVSYDISTAENGGLVWIDRNYRFYNLPTYLVGALLFQVNHKDIPEGTTIQITVQAPSTIYIAHESTLHQRSGGFENSLSNSGWILEDDNAGIVWSEAGGNFKYVWKKVVSAYGPTTITLPTTTTTKTVHSIFVKGNTFIITLELRNILEFNIFHPSYSK